MAQQLSLSLPKPRKVTANSSSDRRRRPRAKIAAGPRAGRLHEYLYTFDEEGRRVLLGLDYEETREFELLEAQLPMYAVELRWLELFNKHEHERAPQGGTGGPLSTERPACASNRPNPPAAFFVDTSPK